MSFTNLPNEVILLLIPHLQYENEINALCCTTQWLHKLLNPILYKRSLTQRNGGYTLEWAAINGSVSTVQLILKAGAPPNACGGEQWQPFALAALHGHSAIIRLLYERGINPCSTDNDWKNRLDKGSKNHLDNRPYFEGWEEGHPLSMAASSGHVSVVNLLLEYGVRPDLLTGYHEEKTALHLAAEKGHLDVIHVLADAGSPINAQDGSGATPLALAAQEDYLDVVQFLLSRGANPNVSLEGWGTSLCMASRFGNIDVVRCLLDHGATPNPSYPDGMKPLFQLSHAAEGGYDDIVELLLSRFDYIKSSTEPYQQAILLCVAALTGRTTLLTNLLTKENYDPNLCVTDRRVFLLYEPFSRSPTTALGWAVEFNQLAAIDILLSHGASISPATNDSTNNSTANKETPPLIRAIKKGHKEAVATLLAHGANPNNPPGEALSSAIQKPLIFSLLISHNADPTSPLPRSSLFTRVLDCDNVETLRILLDHPKYEEIAKDPVSEGRQIGPSEASLFLPALWGGEGVFRFLRDRGLLTAPKNIHDEYAWQYLAMAIWHGSVPFVRLLLDMGFDLRAVDNVGHLVHTAAKADEDPEGLLDFLLQNGCSINDTDMRGRTAFFLAAGDGRQDAMRRLLERGADLLVAFEGETPLSVAAREQKIGAVEFILEEFDERELSLGEVEGALKRAQKNALEVDRADIAMVLHRSYWRMRYPVSP
ncbi:hypothetical protein PITC_074510 [Penicillium italicum]|uniref:Uncharacterized protein n=1 Tax=Penicillium italicum TaxID=40296 RepID=A0A0A2LMQ1_PENIT|nr:hypothetical protein PITC_074510 [Penicillium italicum]